MPTQQNPITNAPIDCRPRLMKPVICVALLLASGAMVSPSMAVDATFAKGPVISDFGPHADVPGAAPIPGGQRFAISFDTATQAGSGEMNRTLESAARFINMHAAAGVPTKNIKLAVVVHGKAVRDVSGDPGENPNTPLVDALAASGVRVIVCGQSAAYYGVSVGDLLPDVEMALSAMTAHAQLQQTGYTINPF